MTPRSPSCSTAARSRFPKEHEEIGRYTCTTGTPLKIHRLARTTSRVPEVHRYLRRSVMLRRVVQSDRSPVMATTAAFSKEATPQRKRGIWAVVSSAPAQPYRSRRVSTFATEADLVSGAV